MIKFFRNIRQKLLAQQRISQYLKYAIGEIILVVVGILIALQINNMNEERKDQHAKEEAVFDLKNEFISNKENFINYLKFKEAVLEEWNSHLSTITGPYVPNSLKMISRPRTGGRLFNLNNTALQSILTSGKFDKIKNSELKQALTSWDEVYSNFYDQLLLHFHFWGEEFAPYERRFIRTTFGEVEPSYSFMINKEMGAAILMAVKDKQSKPATGKS